MFPIKNFSDIKSPINLSKKTRWTLAPVDWGPAPGESTGWTKKKWDLKNNGHNSAEIHQKGKKLVCFGKFCINAAG